MSKIINTACAKTVVFYDGGCPLCSREIKHYMQLNTVGRIEWTDITLDRTLINALNVSFQQAMQRLHVLDRTGVLVDGARAFLAIWAELPRYRILTRLIYGCRAVPILEKAYSFFAVRRYKSRCRTLECSVLPPNRQNVERHILHINSIL